jgi:hypothetical protein
MPWWHHGDGPYRKPSNCALADHTPLRLGKRGVDLCNVNGSTSRPSAVTMNETRCAIRPAMKATAAREPIQLRHGNSALGGVRCELVTELADLYPASAKKLVNWLRASSSMTVRTAASTTLCQGVPTAFLLQNQGRRTTRFYLHGYAAHHRSAAPATMATALELCMATEKIVVAAQKGFRTTRCQITPRSSIACSWGDQMPMLTADAELDDFDFARAEISVLLTAP